VESTPEETPVEVDRNGKRLGASQLAWKEYRDFAESHSSKECKARARVDAGFASFVRINLEREMSGPIGGAGTILNSRTETKAAPPELIAWVNEYRTTPMTTVRQ
jgi:hypothetical protein